MNRKKTPPRKRALATSPARHLESELLRLRAELRQTIRSYSARLEIQLAQTLTTLKASAPPEELPRERLHQLRDLTTMMRKRKVKPEKGRRKDLRKIDSLITDLHSSLPNGQDR
ncbi:MAG: hypothetical protein ABIR71_07495 [Chthoniobacterales bacterium]